MQLPDLLHQAQNQVDLEKLKTDLASVRDDKNRQRSRSRNRGGGWSWGGWNQTDDNKTDGQPPPATPALA